VGPRSVVVKSATAPQGPNPRSLRAELCAYRLARWVAPLAAVMPGAVLVDERQQALVMECLSAAPTWPHPETTPRPLSPAEAVALAEAMARWHHATLDVALAPSLAHGILGLPADIDVAGRDRPESTRRLMARIAADPELAPVLSAAAAGYSARCLIHGDLRRENVMVDEAGRLRVIDWDLSGGGDPAWDLGSLVAQLVLEPARQSLALGRGSALDAWSAETGPRVSEVVAAYARAGGPVALGSPEAIARLLDFALARLLHVACEWSDWDGNEDHSAALVELARTLPSRAASVRPAQAGAR
jgi:aminoglycoside phosphotransferase (APT) family kinase protein